MMGGRGVVELPMKRQKSDHHSQTWDAVVLVGLVAQSVLYSSKTLLLDVGGRRRVEVFGMKYLGRVLGICVIDRISNPSVRE